MYYLESFPLTIFVALCIVGLITMWIGLLELYRIIRYRKFWFNEDTAIALGFLIVGSGCVFFGVSILIL